MHWYNVFYHWGYCRKCRLHSLVAHKRCLHSRLLRETELSIWRSRFQSQHAIWHGQYGMESCPTATWFDKSIVLSSLACTICTWENRPTVSSWRTNNKEIVMWSHFQSFAKFIQPQLEFYNPSSSLCPLAAKERFCSIARQCFVRPDHCCSLQLLKKACERK